MDELTFFQSRFRINWLFCFLFFFYRCLILTLFFSCVILYFFLSFILTLFVTFRSFSPDLSPWRCGGNKVRKQIRKSHDVYTGRDVGQWTRIVVLQLDEGKGTLVIG